MIRVNFSISKNFLTYTNDYICIISAESVIGGNTSSIKTFSNNSRFSSNFQTC